MFDHVVLPALARFAPDLILVSAGFDAYEHDPLAGMRVTQAGFAAMAAAAARAPPTQLCGGRVVAVLEGGYDLDGLGGGMTAVLEALLAARRQRRRRSRRCPRRSTLARAAIDGTLAAHAAAGVAIPAPEVAAMKRHRTADLEPISFGGRYTLVRRLAIGGMAEIYLARQAAMAGFEKEVVIKRLRAELADDPRIVEMFLDEAKIGAALNHPNIVHVYDVDEHDGIPYIAMEYIIGEELNELCRRGIELRPLPAARARRRADAPGRRRHGLLPRQAVDRSGSRRPPRRRAARHRPPRHLAVEPARHAGRLPQDHRLRHRARAGPDAAAQRRAAGQAQLHVARAGGARARSITAATCSRSASCSTRSPSGGGCSAAPRTRSCSASSPRRSSRRRSRAATFPPALESIVMRALEKHPDDRYQSAYDLADDLESFLRDEKLHSGPVRIARYLDMLAIAAGGARRPELISEAEARARRRRSGARLRQPDVRHFKPAEGAPGPEQAASWEDVEQPEAEVAAALGLELAELRAMRTPVPTRPSGVIAVPHRGSETPPTDGEELPTDVTRRTPFRVRSRRRSIPSSTADAEPIPRSPDPGADADTRPGSDCRLALRLRFRHPRRFAVSASNSGVRRAHARAVFTGAAAGLGARRHARGGGDRARGVHPYEMTRALLLIAALLAPACGGGESHRDQARSRAPATRDRAAVGARARAAAARDPRRRRRAVPARRDARRADRPSCRWDRASRSSSCPASSAQRAARRARPILIGGEPFGKATLRRGRRRRGRAHRIGRARRIVARRASRARSARRSWRSIARAIRAWSVPSGVRERCA